MQETLTQTLRHIEDFEPRHDGALQAYLRQALINRVRDEVRRVTRYPAPAGIETMSRSMRTHRRLRSMKRSAMRPWNDMKSALQRLRPEEREVIIARVELQQSYAQIAAAHGKASPDAARMAVTRALVRLAEEMDV